MVQSGYTSQAKAEQARWYNAEFPNVKNEPDWDWGLNEQAMEHLLDTRVRIPFRNFMIRYLLYAHISDLMESNINIYEEHKVRWVEERAKTVIRSIEAESDCKDEEIQDGEVFLQKIVDLAFEDFTGNKYCRPVKKQKKVYGSLSVNAAVKWEKQDLREKITAFSIKDSDMYGFAFGLNMSYEDLDFFLKKAFFRPGLDLWKPEDFLLYITFKYAQGDKYVFWCSITKAYDDIKIAPPGNAQWLQADNFSTAAITLKVKEMVQAIIVKNYVFSLDQNGNLPNKVLDLLRDYYALTGSPNDYTRTAVKEMKGLLVKIESNLEGKIKAANKESKKPLAAATGQGVLNPNLAQGSVKVYYSLKKGLNIPQGTAFIKKASGRDIRFICVEDIQESPISGDPLIDIELKLISKKEEPKQENSESMTFYIPNQSEFFSKESCLSEMKNKSGFKTQKKKVTETIDTNHGPKKKLRVINAKDIHVGEPVHTGGIINARCHEGKVIKAGTLFWAKNLKGEKVEFISEKDVEAVACKDIHVYCEAENETAEKNQITGCSLDNKITNIIKIENSKIGFNQKPAGTGNNGGRLCSYLYSEISIDWDFNDVLQEKYLDQLGSVLEGTRILPAKISNIKNGKNVSITRSDVITFSFLAYMSELEKIREESELEPDEAYKDYGRADLDNPKKKSRYSGFIVSTNKLLAKCGYYEIYYPNPYDSLILLLLSNNYAIDAFRNLWSWYLGKKKGKPDETEGCIQNAAE